MLNKKVGYVGLGASVVAMLLAWVNFFLHKSPLSPIILVAAPLYLVGGLAGVLAFGYKRGSKMYFFVSGVRVLFVSAVIITIFSGYNG